MSSARLGLVVHDERELAAAVGRSAIEWAERSGVEPVIPIDTATTLGCSVAGGSLEQLTESDLIVAVGGDGTVLRAVRRSGDARAPFMAVNAGRLGYLTDLAPDAVVAALESWRRGGGRRERRMRVGVSVAVDATTPAEPLLPGLNEVVLERDQPGHTVRIRVEVDDEFFTSHLADGVIVATPTGSTAYALSVRGPIVAPEHEALIVVPVAPHSLFDRSLVLAPTSSVTLEVAGHRPARLFVDGESETVVMPGGRVRCDVAADSVTFLRFEDHPFHQVLKRKFSLADR